MVEKIKGEGGGESGGEGSDRKPKTESKRGQKVI